ncbi:MAG: tryptophan-rich sensory protein [Sphingomonas sp.]
MTTAINRTGRSGLLLNIVLLVALVLIGNALIFGLGFDNGQSLSAAQQAWVPPGAVIGAIWVVQFALMGAARWLWLRDSRDRGWRSNLPWLIALICLAFPVYTGGLDDPSAGAIGTLATVVVVVATMLVLGRRSSAAAWALVPLAVWGSYVACVYYLA